MTTLAPTVLELTEFQATFLPAGRLDPAVGEQLWREYGKYISVEPPGLQDRRPVAAHATGLRGLHPADA